MRLVILGPPGAGKGTQSRRLAELFSIPHLSTGDILRAAIKDGSAVGLRAKEMVDKGGLVSDELVFDIVKARLAEPDASAGFVMDGFPRTLAQALALDQELTRGAREINAAVELEVASPVLFDRVEQRAHQAAKSGAPVRTDDKPEILEQRLAAFAQANAAVAQHYKDQRKLMTINGVGDVDAVTKGILLALKPLALT